MCATPEGRQLIDEPLFENRLGDNLLHPVDLLQRSDLPLA
jgi:hypothetical protein